MLTEFLRWWGRNLLAGLSSRHSGKQPALGDGIIVDLADDESFHLVRRKRGRETSLGRVSPDGANAARTRQMIGKASLTLRLGAGWLLERMVHLPLAAEAQLESVLRLDMDRLSPFSADEVLWSHNLVRRDTASGQIVVRLNLIPIPPALATITSFGLKPNAVAAQAAHGDWCVIPLHNVLIRRGSFDGAALRLSAGLAAALALAVIAVPLYLQEASIAATDTSIAALRPAAGEAETLRRGLLAARDGEAALASMRSGGANPISVIATVTAALPDDTFLTELSLRGTALEFRGQSHNAARLVGLLSDESALQAVAFAAPVTRADTASVELFAIRAVVKP